MANEIRKCTIVSGAPNANIEFINSNIDKSSYIICADSGYNALKGIVPNVIVGDFDSSPRPDIDCEIIELEVEKAYTDTFECVMLAIERGYNYIEIFNAIGSRLDHTYANILCLDYCKKHNAKCYIINENNRISLINEKTIIKKEYQNISLFAHNEPCKSVTIKGAYYTASFYDKTELDIDLDSQFATSNYIVGDECEINLKSGTLLLIESND